MTHAMAPGLQREQHGQRRQMVMGVAVMIAGVPAMAVVMIVMIMVVVVTAMMMVVAMALAAMSAAIVLRLAFIQLKRLAHTDIVFAHM
jgi:hypothetical protein